VAAPKQGTIYLAVAERVPFAEFPLPPRPAVVHPPKPDGIGTEPGGQILHSDAADPQKTQTTKIIWRYGYDYSLAILPSTPGVYTVALDGIPVGTVETYDYRGGGKGWTYGAGTLPKIANGRTVTVTFTAQYANRTVDRRGRFGAEHQRPRLSGRGRAHRPRPPRRLVLIGRL
jgi:hypothetical protein